MASQSPALPAIAAGMGLGAGATGIPQDAARDAGQHAITKAHDWMDRPPAPADYSKSPWRLEEPEARYYKQRENLNRAGKYAGWTGAATLGAATPVLGYGALQIAKEMGLSGQLLQLLNPEMGPFTLLAAAPVAAGYGAYKSGQAAHQAGKRQALLRALLDANYRRDMPAMEDGPLTDY